MKPMIAAAVGAAVLLGSANAASFSFQTQLTGDTDAAFFTFEVGPDSLVTFRTYSYAGGEQADGTTVEAGGFDPILSVFDSAGNFLFDVDDGFDVAEDPVTFEGYDVELTSPLPEGDYLAAITVYDNFAVGPALSDGFDRDNEGNFTSDFCDPGFYDFVDGVFCDAAGDDRTGNLAFDILGVENAEIGEVPLPGAALLFGSALAGLGLRRKRR